MKNNVDETIGKSIYSICQLTKLLTGFARHFFSQNIINKGFTLDRKDNTQVHIYPSTYAYYEISLDSF